MSICHLTSVPKPLNVFVNNLYGNLSLKVVGEFEFWLKLDEYEYLEWFSWYSDGPYAIPGSARFFSPPQRPGRRMGPLSLLSNGYRWLFPKVRW